MAEPSPYTGTASGGPKTKTSEKPEAESGVYSITTTSNASVDVADVALLSEGDGDAHLEGGGTPIRDTRLIPREDKVSATTRKVVRASLVDNAHSEVERVRIVVVHQKRHKRNQPWQDYDNFDLRTLTGGQEAQLSLSPAETSHLHKILTDLLEITKDGVPQKSCRLKVIDEAESVAVSGKAAEVVRQFCESHPDEVWDHLQQIEPDILKTLALKKLHELRERAVEVFEEHLKNPGWEERHWQKFFERNTGIFGLGLIYHFLDPVTFQPRYGGGTVYGQGEQHGDYLLQTGGDYRFTVLVELKRPETPLVDPNRYRNGAYRPSGELAGAIAQIQANCSTWDTQGSKTPANIRALDKAKCHTAQPKGILLIGHTNKLADDEQRNSFELCRRNLANPEILTFDELLARAKHLLLTEEREFSPPETE